MGENISYNDDIHAGVCVTEGVWQGYTTSDPYITPKPPQRRIFENFNLTFKY